MAFNVIGSLNSTSNYFTINSATTSPSILGINQNGTFVFNVTASATAPLGAASTINYSITGGGQNQYSSSQVFPLTIGFAPAYCSAQGNDTAEEFIKQVIINTINNSSTPGDRKSVV